MRTQQELMQAFEEFQATVVEEHKLDGQQAGVDDPRRLALKATRDGLLEKFGLLSPLDNAPGSPWGRG